MRFRPIGRIALAASVLALAACGGSGSGSASRQGGVVSSSSRAASSRASGGTTATSAAGAAGDWTRFDYDAARAGVGPRHTGITPRTVRRLRRRVVRIGGVADSAPVELHAIRVAGRDRDVAIVTSTYGKTIAIDAATGRALWQFIPPDIRSYLGTAQITTATPVADPDRRYVYAASPDGMIRKLALASGHEVRSGGWPARITFAPRREKIAGALNISGRDVIAVTGGYYGDAPSYQGHVVLIDRASGKIAHLWNSLCSNRHALIVRPRSCPASDSAIWARAGAVVEPVTHRILVATGNGPFNGSTDWGDSVLELSPDARLLHNWTPTDQAQLAAGDGDLGSTAPALLPNRLALQGGKDARLHLLDLARLNGTTGGPGPRLGGELEELPSPGGVGVLTAPAVWRRGGLTYVFVADDAGTSAYLVSAGAAPRLRIAWRRRAGGTSPIVAGGLLYVYDEHAGTLDVRSPASGRLLAALPAAPGHWSSPIVIGGRIILPVGGSTLDSDSSGIVYIYHLPGR